MSTSHRKLHFDRLEEAVAEVERLAKVPVQTTGNFTFPQIVEHLATAFDISSGHQTPPPVPWLIRVVAPLMAKRAAHRPMKPGLKLPQKAQAFFWRDAEQLEDALSQFRTAYERYRSIDTLPRHPLFGNLSREDNEQLQCRHMELHLGFVHPQ
ncbi:DUF1569 domain-containing protein [Roseiconus lacunae]|uniref:DUF1569 domain-containing protein n=1 Tax=Roseiconus lacunae TaxID=2605694 RepID=A0ABT7PGM7_9BACT|nr:DUF1569 domain-containing protein [Roseiconus lacunae]MCD0458243.1 DUF1569 domain-containing protein [Roseiconus lacunae]MDM4015657.1 DUF1569 domain-containing protein [Roseiconus lacunae]WRQ52259.1 DUF1569 domain-containing protein [Stieleria sp. HD01]